MNTPENQPPSAPATGSASTALTLTPEEIAYAATSPDGLQSAMDYHDLQIVQGESMGFDCSAHRNRYDELRAERDRIQAEWSGFPNTQASDATHEH